MDIKYNQLSTLADYNIALTLAGIVIAEVRPWTKKMLKQKRVIIVKQTKWLKETMLLFKDPSGQPLALDISANVIQFGIW